MSRQACSDGFTIYMSMFIAMLGAAFAWSVSIQNHATASSPEADVLSIGGSVTEIIYALDQQHRLVGRDTTSSWPPETEALPDVGYIRALSPEGVLAVNPKLIIAEDGAGPPEAIDVLRDASVEMVVVPDDFSAQGILNKIRIVGDALDVKDRADALISETSAALAAAETAAQANGGSGKRVMFILSTEGGRIMASGTGTEADGVIKMAGGTNAITDFEGYKQISDEAVIAAAPDAILMMDRDGDFGMATDDLLDLPAIATTPAAEARAVIKMNGLLLLGFGPRTAEAVRKLSAALRES
ncbi:hemin ABC transporter substrate-binding protein [Marivita sp. S0852]|uniref:heme/hemin ABC transporter substrate-binding protein n=1 Tax=Marivita sp. S0852 TaxID=3373893 RepID=UPI003982A66C